MAYKVSVDIDIGAIQQEILGKMLPVVAQAVAMTAENGANRWRSMVENAKLAPYEKAAYLDSISWHMTGATSAEISSSYKLANEIETGIPSRDMKKVLQTSTRTRVSNSKAHKGQKYLIIPFIHNTPGNTAHSAAMPKEVYAKAKYLSKSSVTGATTRISGSGHSVKQDIYQWGQRLPNGLLGPNQKGKHDRYSGMVKMNLATGGSPYRTFRIMAEWSTGWIYPAKPGLFIAKDIAEKLQPLLEQSLSKAIALSK